MTIPILKKPGDGARVTLDSAGFLKSLRINHGKNGILKKERLNDAVTRILALKAALKLHERVEKAMNPSLADDLRGVGFG